MSILFSGDFHANARGELEVVTKESLLHKYGNEIYDTVKYHVILGDGGFGWLNNEKRDKRNYKELAERPFPILAVHGNHEPVYGRRKIKEEDIGLGETVLKINDNPFTAYLKRGKAYVIDGIKFLVLGGALSIDKYRRTPNKSWWKKEYWSSEEKDELFKLLETDNSFDYVISHTGPLHINIKLFHPHYPLHTGGISDKMNDKVAKLNDEIHKKINFREWWAGHYHEDIYHYCKKTSHGYQYLYWTSKIIEKKENDIRILNEFDKERISR
ncbi:MAG: metallophosphoesterase [Treponema sp.]|nr:metallophosphoesterase [Treponema sp.]MCL2272752.1 metallophosphoesterase [Treponema sp.]